MTAEELLFIVAFAAYIASTVAFIASLPARRELLERIGLWLAVGGFVVHTAALAVRSLNAGRLPFSNQYEFATSFAWGIVACFLLLQHKYRLRSVGAFVMPLAFLMMGYASMLSKEIRPLMPALQSGWLTLHVGMAIVSYGAFALAAALGVKYVARTRKVGDLAALTPSAGMAKTESDHPDESRERLELFDFLAYRVTAFGLLMLTLVILTGMVWAKSAWGRYWSWDPKETWSLVTWIIYAVYLHLRLNRGWRGRRSAWFSVIGLVCVLFTFLGVNVILPGLHSYF